MLGAQGRAAGSDLPAAMEGLLEEAREHERARNPRGAANAYAAYLIFQIAAREPFNLIVVERLASSLTKLGDVVEAIRILSAIRNQGRAVGDGYAETFAVLRMAQVAVTAGEPASAAKWLADVEDSRGRWGEPLAERSLELLERASVLAWPETDGGDLALLRAEASLVLAQLWASRGQYAAAEAAVRQTLELTGEREMFRTRRELALFLAELRLDRGDFSGAEAVARQYAPLPGADGAQPWEVIRVQGLLMSGQLGKARARALQALELREGDPRATLLLYWLLAQAATLINRSAEAEQHIAAALGRIPPGESFRGWGARFSELHELNQRRAGMGAADWEPARLPEQVLEIGEESDEAAPANEGTAPHGEPKVPSRRRARFIDEWAGRTLKIHRALAAGNLAAASMRLEELEAFAAGTDSEYLRARTRYFAGLVAYQGGDYSKALEAFSTARAHAASTGLDMYAWESQRALSWACARLGLAEEHARHAAEARARLDAIVAQLDAHDAVYFSLNKWTARDEYVASRVRELERFEPRPLPLPWLRSWWNKRQRSLASARVLRELNELVAWNVDRILSPKQEGEAPASTPVDPEEASTADQVARWIEARRVQAQRQRGKKARWNPEGPVAGWPWRMPRRVAVLQYHVLADRLLVFLVTRSEVRCQVFQGVTRIRLRELADEALATVQEQSPARGAPCWSNWHGCSECRSCSAA